MATINLDNLQELRSEFAARGFQYLPGTRKDRLVNLGYMELCEEEDWPFLEATTSGTAPLTVSDLRTIESVTNTTNELELLPRDRRELVSGDPALDATGTAVSYYITGGDTINVYPANTADTFKVLHWKVPAQLDDESDTPLVPSRWRYLIIERACVIGYRDDDETEMMEACEAAYDKGLAKMRYSLMLQQHNYPTYIAVRASSSSS